jgi:hypothetical protein
VFFIRADMRIMRFGVNFGSLIWFGWMCFCFLFATVSWERASAHRCGRICCVI